MSFIHLVLKRGTVSNPRVQRVVSTTNPLLRLTLSTTMTMTGYNTISMVLKKSMITWTKVTLIQSKIFYERYTLWSFSFKYFMRHIGHITFNVPTTFHRLSLQHGAQNTCPHGIDHGVLVLSAQILHLMLDSSSAICGSSSPVRSIIIRGVGGEVVEVVSHLFILFRVLYFLRFETC
jgi:hypothetical protein